MSQKQFIKNTDNPAMIVYYLNKHRNELKHMAEAPKGTYKLTDFYRLVRPAFIEAPDKPYTNALINKVGKTVRRGKATAEGQASSLVRLIERNEDIFGYGGGIRRPLEPKDILSDRDLAIIETK